MIQEEHDTSSYNELREATGTHPDSKQSLSIMENKTSDQTDAQGTGPAVGP